MAIKILFVSYGGGHISMILPVAKHLDNIGFDVNILPLTTARNVALKSGLKCFSMTDFLDPVDNMAVEIGSRLLAHVQGNPDVTHEESVAYHGLNYIDLLNAHGSSGAEVIYSKYGRQSFLPVDLMKRILSKINPDVVVCTSAPRTERATIIAAGLLRIKSIVLVDLFASFEIEWIKHNKYANAICVLNSTVKSKIVESGRDENDVYVTGNPAFDLLLDDKTVSAGAKIRTERGWNSKTVILWASQPEPTQHPSMPNSYGDSELPSKILNKLISICTNNSEYVLVYRPHPSENVNETDLRNNILFSPKSEFLDTLLYAVDIVVIMTSTVGLQAHIVNSVVIQVEGSVYTSSTPYVEYGIADFSCDLDGLNTIIPRAAELMNNRRVNMDIDATKSIAKIRGSATFNVCDIIQSVCSDK